jgi:hypothetical protein
MPPRRLATSILALVMAGYVALAIVGVVFATHSTAEIVISVLAPAGAAAGLCEPSDRSTGRPLEVRALLVQAAPVFLPIRVYGPVWHGFPGVLAGSALIMLPMVIGVPVFLLVVVRLVAVSVSGAEMTELMT